MRKAFLCVNITEDENNEKIDGLSLATARVTAEQENAFQRIAQEAEEIYSKKAKLPLPVRIVGWVCGFIALLLIAGILKADVDFKTSYENAAPLFYIAGVTAVIWAAISLAGFFRNRKVMNSDETQSLLSRSENYAENLYSYLGVPSDAKNVDVLMMWYKIKDDRRKIKKIVDETHQNYEYRMFVSDGNLCIADTLVRYEIPLDGITAMRRVNEKAVISDWNKEEPFNGKKYKPYKITSDKYETNYFFKYYISLEFTAGGEEYEMFLPPYEAETVSAFTGLALEV